MSYPWNTGDPLLAVDLNAAIANAGALSGFPAGPTSARPALPAAGRMIVYGDTTLHQPVFGFSTGWVNASGTSV